MTVDFLKDILNIKTFEYFLAEELTNRQSTSSSASSFAASESSDHPSDRHDGSKSKKDEQEGSSSKDQQEGSMPNDQQEGSKSKNQQEESTSTDQQGVSDQPEASCDVHKTSSCTLCVTNGLKAGQV